MRGAGSHRAVSRMRREHHRDLRQEFRDRLANLLRDTWRRIERQRRGVIAPVADERGGHPNALGKLPLAQSVGLEVPTDSPRGVAEIALHGGKS